MIIIIIIQRKFFFLFVVREPTTWPANNCLQINNGLLMRNAVQLCLAANNILHMHKGNWHCFSPSCDRSCMKMADHFTHQGYSLKKQTQWSNDKTIIELGYHKISWFVSVWQINNICLSLSDILLNLVQ